MRTPWPHQGRAIAELRAGFAAGGRHGLLVMPTGAGKSATAWMMAAAGIAKGNRAVFVADRRVLVSQAARSAHEFGLPVGVVMRDAGYDWKDPHAPLQVVSKDSLVSWLARPEFALPPADFVIVDECHKSLTDSWAALRAAYPHAREVGLTATPCRADGKGLGRRYDFLVQPTTYAELQSLGVLVRPTCYAPGGKVEGKAGRKPTRAGLVGDAVFWWKRWAAGLRTFAFCSDVGHSLAVRDEYRRAGVRAEHIDAATPDAERDDILGRLAAGQVQVVTNCAVLRYGVDVPAVECAQILAAMGSVVDYRQSSGRVLRSAPGKAGAVVIDHAGAVLYHGFPDADLPWTLDDAEDHGERQRQRMEAGEAPKPIACPECHTLFSGSRQCPGCQWVVPSKRAKPQATEAGTLTEVRREAAAAFTPDELNRVWKRCLGVAANKGLKVSAAAAMFFKQAGRWPEGCGVEPQPQTRAEWSRPAAEVFRGSCGGPVRRRRVRNFRTPNHQLRRVDVNTGIKTEQRCVTPAQAEHMLKASATRNRATNTAVVKRLAKDMKDGGWVFNGEPIILDPAGNLLDGHHRLHACVLAGVPFETLVVTGVANTAILTIDTGSSRDGTDVLEFAGHTKAKTLAATARLVFYAESEKLVQVYSDRWAAGCTNAALAAVVDRHPMLPKHAQLGTTLHRKFRGCPPSIFGFASFWFSRHDPEQAESFVHSLADGSCLSQGHPVLHLRNRLTADLGSKSKLPALEKLALVVKAWRLVCRGEKVGVLRWSALQEEFPDPTYRV
jgi:DNA repair protein RadD